MRSVGMTCPAVAIAIGLLASSAAVPATVEEVTAQGAFCSATATALSNACGNETDNDYWVHIGVCINTANAAARASCFGNARRDRIEAQQLCSEQRVARFDACKLLGEGRYDPPFEAALFDANFGNLTNPNAYFPLGIGNQWEFLSQTQSTKVRVLNETKLIEGVRCIVVRDEVTEGGDLIESTNDWYAQAKDGNVWYCGEETSEFESFDGDRPRKPERVSIEGSFKAGREGDKPGIIFLAAPTVGQPYVEESSLGNAEDATVILSTNYSYGKNATLDQMVPANLAKFLCAGDCVVTKNFSSLEPGAFERKYYARGIGVFLEIELDTGEVVRLVGCNVDPRCASLPH